MKQLKKLAALVLAVAMAATAAVPAWAATGEENKNNGGTQSGSTAATELQNGGEIYVTNYNVEYGEKTLIFRDGKKVQQAYAKVVTLNVVDTRIKKFCVVFFLLNLI